MSEEKIVEVLMVSLPLQGHLNPMLNLGKHLVSKGVCVTFATTEDDRLRMNQNLHNSDIQFEFFSDGLSFDFDRANKMSELIKSVHVHGSKNFSTLLTRLTKVHNYSCVIVNPFVPFAIDVIADHNIPCAMFWIQASALYSIYYRYYKNIDSFPNLENPNEKVHLPSMPIFDVRDLPPFILPSCPPHLRVYMNDLFQAIDKVKWVLGTSFYEIEEEIVKSMDSLKPIYPIGSMVSPFLFGEKETNDFKVDMWNVEDSCIEWLDNKPPSSVIYISFGSIIALSQKQMNNVALALKNSNKSFLWVIRTHGSNNSNASDLPLEFLEETKGRGFVVKWSPQEKVLMHPAVACFISHCGWNSTIESLVTGVSVICYPHWADQRTNAMLIENMFQNGVNLKYDEDRVASTQEIERCIREVMEGPSALKIKKRAREIKELARKSLQEGGASRQNLDKFVNDLTITDTVKA
ncbi:hypothetical protein TanjilG_07683 [Lupinus angustifolius]|uniref:Glycosyltransferase N-terminal domain-containing protein n=1 Tax=Lupinus angustifolius TaxID=3871 RepID=A0A1J7GW18_LUPAN|nr:PREDICTED: UDP-glycosyltransferase 84B2-like [Lupinus angustifolius]OIV93780.1 hypothetical protein TanjilG_07683 [Lupinus angustifolius]